MNDITYGGGQFVAVGDAGTILTSVDSKTWTGQASPTGDQLVQIAYLGGMYIVTGRRGTVLTSTTGTNWNATSLAFNTASIWRTHVAFGNGIFVLASHDDDSQPTGGDIPKLWTSTNGTDWQQVLDFNPLPGATLNEELFFGSNRFMYLRTVSGTNGEETEQALGSSDGSKWEALPLPDANPPNGVVKVFKGNFLATNGDTNVWTSLDGLVWTPQEVGATNEIYFFSQSENALIGIGWSNIISSVDGVHWGPQLSMPANNYIRAAAYGNDTYAVLTEVDGENVQTLFSVTDAGTWTNQLTIGGSNFYDADSSRGALVVVGYNALEGVIVTSPDGTEWTTRHTEPNSILTAVTHGAGIFLAGGFQFGPVFPPRGFLITSTDGISWGNRTELGGTTVTGAAYGNGVFTVVGGYPFSASIMTFENGQIRSSKALDPGDLIFRVTFGNGLFVAVGGNSVGGDVLAKAWISPDGFSWTTVNVGVSNLLKSVAFGDGRFVAAGEGGSIVTSVDGQNWTTQTTAGLQDFNAVAYGHGSFVLAGGQFNELPGPAQPLLSSTNEVDWGSHLWHEANAIWSLLFANGSFFSVGENGGILQSGPLIDDPLAIAKEPSDNKVLAGSTVSFEVEAVGLKPVSYQWFKDDLPIPTAAESVLLLTNVQPSDAGRYSVRVSNSAGSKDSRAATLDVGVGHPPEILSQPGSIAVPVDSRVLLSVKVTGDLPLLYQWQFNGIDITNATASSLLLKNAQTSDAGTYTVAVMNRSGKTLSDPATLVVAPVAPINGGDIFLNGGPAVSFQNGFFITISGTAGQSAKILRTSDFLFWEIVGTFTFTNDTQTIADDNPFYSAMGFYTAQSVTANIARSGIDGKIFHGFIIHSSDENAVGASVDFSLKNGRFTLPAGGSSPAESGSYVYTKVGPDAATLSFLTDNGGTAVVGQRTLTLGFDSSTTGSASYRYIEGDSLVQEGQLSFEIRTPFVGGKLTAHLLGCSSPPSWSISVSGEDFSSNSISTSYQYDAFGRVRLETGSITATNSGRHYSYSATYTYNFSNCPTSMTFTMSGGLLNPSPQTVTVFP